MEGLLKQIQKCNTLEYERLTFEDLEKWFEGDAEKRAEVEKEKQFKIKNNLKELEKRAKELNKEVPQELLLCIYIDQPMSKWFFDKYEEWFN